MASDSSNECSTDFESSTSIASVTSEEQYDDDDFDDYSDSFESDNEASTAAVSNSTELDLLSVGTRVQVFWREENEWFDGEIQCVEEGNEPRYFVHYDDGEQQWEAPSSIRPLPVHATRAQYDQLQQLLPLSAQSAREMVGRSAIVYWPDEGEWYHGVVGAAQASPAALKIEYDDGDSRWEQEHTFNCILLLQATMDAPKTILPSSFTPEIASAPPSPPERVLYARSYKQVVSDHFQPVRIARPYRCSVEKHSESVIIPRRSYSERRYLHVVHEVLECSRCDQHIAPHSFLVEKADSITQATLYSCFTDT